MFKVLVKPNILVKRIPILIILLSFKIKTEIILRRSISILNRYQKRKVLIRGTKLLLDDISAIKNLKAQSVSQAQRRDIFTLLLGLVYALIFYFELNQYYLREDQTYVYTRSIDYRLALDLEGRQYLYNLLQSTLSYFLTLSQPTPYVTYVPRILLSYKRVIKVVVNSLNNDISITLLGIISILITISRLLRTVRNLIYIQHLYTPFRRANCSTVEKMLLRILVQIYYNLNIRLY